LTAPGHRFERGIFALVGAVPFAVAWVALPICLAFFPEGLGPGPALGLGLAMGYSAYALRYPISALRKPEGTLVEELKGGKGVKFYEPVA
jgi:hypothetical protein